MTRMELLERAEKIVCGVREQAYGSPEDNFATIADLWTVYLSAAHAELKELPGSLCVTATDVAMMMALLKVARIASGETEDSFVDLAGYAACGCELATRSDNQIWQCEICGAPVSKGQRWCENCILPTPKQES